MSTETNIFLDRLEKISQERPFLTSKELVEVRVFETLQDARTARLSGQIAFWEMSPKFFVCPISEVVRYLLARQGYKINE